jgi:sulfur carrier protein
MSLEDTVSVLINGKDRQVPKGYSVSRLLEWLELNPALVVVELNREILERDRHDEIEVKKDDALELVHFVGGG